MNAACRNPQTGTSPVLAPAGHYLLPCAIFASAEPHLVTTVLGTCVAVCLWDPIRRIGGINHYMLPLWNGAGLATPKFGNIAIERLIERMEELRCQRSNLVAKVFGGKSSAADVSVLNVGPRNALLAEEMLGEAGIKIVACNLSGPCGLKLLFNTETGVVLLRRIVGLTSVPRSGAH